MGIATNKNTQKLKLSIQVSLNGLSFCILNPLDSQVVFFKQIDFGQQVEPVKIPAKIAQEYEKEAALQQDVDELKLLYSNSLYALVPERLFSEELASNYLKFNAKILKTDFIAHDEIKPASAVCVYIPYANITNYFFEKYGEFEYKHSITILVETLLKMSISEQSIAYLYNKSGNYDLVIIENNRLVFCNTFSYDTPEDFLYYLLFSAEQLGLDPLKFKLQVLGNINKDSDLYKLAYQYVKNISIWDTSLPLTFSSSEDKEKASGEFVLLNSF